jgi:hypothetical protein
MTTMHTWQSTDEVEAAIAKMADRLGTLLAERAIAR